MEKPSIVQGDPNIPQKDLVIPTPKKDLTSAKCRRQEKRGEKKGIEEECIAQKRPRGKSFKSSSHDSSTQKDKALNDPKCSSRSDGKGSAAESRKRAQKPHKETTAAKRKRK